jgi:hypothetical protein
MHLVLMFTSKNSICHPAVRTELSKKKQNKGHIYFGGAQKGG